MKQRNVVGAKGARLLRRVGRHILAEPLRYNQDCIIEHGEAGEMLYDVRQTVPACGTVACIGGWLALLMAPNPRRVHTFNVHKLALLLGVEREQVFRLIAYTHTIDGGWPDKFRYAYQDAVTPLQKARVANKRIEHFIKTGE
jgi:hypothetical protein